MAAVQGAERCGAAAEGGDGGEPGQAGGRGQAAARQDHQAGRHPGRAGPHRLAAAGRHTAPGRDRSIISLHCSCWLPERMERAGRQRRPRRCPPSSPSAGAVRRGCRRRRRWDLR